jgi:hypothetical protein
MGEGWDGGPSLRARAAASFDQFRNARVFESAACVDCCELTIAATVDIALLAAHPPSRSHPRGAARAGPLLRAPASPTRDPHASVGRPTRRSEAPRANASGGDPSWTHRADRRSHKIRDGYEGPSLRARAASARTTRSTRRARCAETCWRHRPPAGRSRARSPVQPRRAPALRDCMKRRRSVRVRAQAAP